MNTNKSSKQKELFFFTESIKNVTVKGVYIADERLNHIELQIGYRGIHSIIAT